MRNGIGIWDCNRSDCWPSANNAVPVSRYLLTLLLQLLEFSDTYFDHLNEYWISYLEYLQLQPYLNFKFWWFQNKINYKYLSDIILQRNELKCVYISFYKIQWLFKFKTLWQTFAAIEYPRDVGWINKHTIYSPLDRLVNWYIRHTSGWTLPLVVFDMDGNGLLTSQDPPVAEYSSLVFLGCTSHIWQQTYDNMKQHNRLVKNKFIKFTNIQWGDNMIE